MRDAKPYRVTVGPSGERIEIFRRQYVDPLTQARESVIGTASEVARVIAEVETRRRELGQGVAVGEVARRHGAAKGPLTWAEVFEEHVAAQKPRWRAKIEGQYRRHVLSYPAFGKGRALVAMCTSVVMREWLDQTTTPGGDPLSPKSKRNLFNLMRACARRGIVARRIDALPWGAWRPPPSDRNASGEAARNIGEVSAFVLEAMKLDAPAWERGEYSDWWARMLFEMVFGLRQGEAAGLGVHDFDLDADEPSVTIRRQVTRGWIERNPAAREPPDLPKGERVRVLGLNRTAVMIVQEHFRALKKHGIFDAQGPVFPSVHKSAHPRRWRSSERLLPCNFMRDLARKIGLPKPEKWTPHANRRTAGTIGAAAGDLEAVRQFLGHSTLAMTAGYVRSLRRGLPQGAIEFPGLEPVALPPANALVAGALDELARAGFGGKLSPRGEFKAARHRAWNKAYARTRRKLVAQGVALVEAKRLASVAGRRAGMAVKASYARALPPPRAARSELPALLLGLLSDRRPLTAAEIAQALAVPLATVKIHLGRLVTGKSLVRNGPARSPVSLYGLTVEAVNAEADHRYTGRLEREPFAPVDHLLRDLGEATANEIAAHLKRAKKRVVYALSNLADAGLCRCIGQGPGARWVSLVETQALAG